MRKKKIDKSKYLSFLQRAEEFHRAMNILEAELKDILDVADMGEYYHQNQYFHAATLLGIHASIAMVDAINVFTLNQRSKGQDHKEASKLLKRAVEKNKVKNSQGIKNFEKIIEEKTNISYGDNYRAGDSNKLKTLREQVDKLFKWAYQEFKLVERSDEI